MVKEYSLPPVEGVVSIAHDLHATSQEAYDNVLKWLSEDYELKDGMREEEGRHKYDGYYCSLKESVRQEYAKCDYCNHYNDRWGCKVHGFSCKNCGKVLYKEFIHRSPVRLYFLNDERGSYFSARYLNFIVHSYDDQKQQLLVYAKPQKHDRFMNVPVDKVPAFLERHKGEYEEVLSDKGKKLLAFKYSKSWDNKDSQIGIEQVGHPPYIKTPDPKTGRTEYKLAEEDQCCHYQMVQVFKGKEYPGGILSHDLPVPDSYSVYPTFRHRPKVDANLSRAIIHAARQVADCGYYYQDGRTAFYDVQFEWMARYIEHFTDLSVENFRKFLKFCRKDGPGFICHLAAWVEHETKVKQYVENKPNIGNLLVGVSKIMSGERLTRGEAKAMKYAGTDREVSKEFMNIFGGYHRDDCGYDED